MIESASVVSARSRLKERSSSTNYLNTLGKNHISRTERAEIEILSENEEFGIILARNSIFSTEITTPVVEEIVPDSPAEFNGRIQVGDKINSINGQSTEDMSDAEIENLLFDCSNVGRVCLSIEYEVSDSIVPTMGIFNVKLKKLVDHIDIGLDLKKNQFGDNKGVLIDRIHPASIACRAGTLKQGDIILAISGIPVIDPKIALVLISKAEGEVKMKVKKIDDGSDSDDDLVTFTVELNRKPGQSLGFSIYCSDDPKSNITVSKISEDGLAAKTGTLKVHDEILEINSICVRQKTLGQASGILQSNLDKVVLKIKRNTKIETELAQEIGPLRNFSKMMHNRQKSNNADSALESWDGAENSSSGKFYNI